MRFSKISHCKTSSATMFVKSLRRILCLDTRLSSSAFYDFLTDIISNRLDRVPQKTHFWRRFWIQIPISNKSLDTSVASTVFKHVIVWIPGVKRIRLSNFDRLVCSSWKEIVMSTLNFIRTNYKEHFRRCLDIYYEGRSEKEGGSNGAILPRLHFE